MLTSIKTSLKDDCIKAMVLILYLQLYCSVSACPKQEEDQTHILQLQIMIDILLDLPEDDIPDASPGYEIFRRYFSRVRPYLYWDF